MAEDSPNKPATPWPEPGWIEADQNPYGVRIFDCRAHALTTTYFTLTQEACTDWLDRIYASGEQYRNKLPRGAIAHLCDLPFPGKGPDKDGALFIPETMEDMWLIYFMSGFLYFIAAQSGDLRYLAKIEDCDDGCHVTRVEADLEGPWDSSWLIVRSVDFILKSHVFRRPVPHPMPPHLASDEYKLIEASSFEYGRRGLFATFEDTLKIPWLTVDPKWAWRVK